MRHVKKLAAIALVLALAAGAAFAQPVTKSKKGDSKSELNPANVSRSITFTGTEVNACLDIQSTVAVIISDEFTEQPIVLTRSFKDALKENADKETIERLVK